MIKACIHHEYQKNHINTFFYDGLNDSTKALIESAVGGQLYLVLCNEVKEKMKEVAP